MTAPLLHEACAELASLLGTWTGRGAGHYPTIADFDYEEEARFWHVGRPFLAYSQRTWNPESGAPMHSEMGYLRPQPQGRIEMVVAHPFGIAEILEGTMKGQTLELSSTSLAATSTAKEVNQITRTITVSGDTLEYSMSMAAVGLPLQHHLSATLHRVTA